MQPAARQPIGFWATRAGAAVIARTRGALADIGMSQPEWWVLHQLSLHPAGMDRTEMIDIIGHNDTPDAVALALDTATTKNWIAVDGSIVHPTESGTAAFARGAKVQTMLQSERMQGVSDEDFATTISVLQRVVSNVGSDAWHW